MGLFRGAVFRHGGGALKQPIKQPTETPTSTLALMGRFPSLMGRFSTLMGRFTDFVLRGRFTSWKSTGKQPIKKRGIKRFLTKVGDSWTLQQPCMSLWTPILPTDLSGPSEACWAGLGCLAKGCEMVCHILQEAAALLDAQRKLQR